jgi:hypothetical protein
LDNDNKNKNGNDITKRQIERKTITAATKFKIDFSFKREVFFIIAGAIMYVIPITAFELNKGHYII